MCIEESRRRTTFWILDRPDRTENTGAQSIAPVFLTADLSAARGRLSAVFSLITPPVCALEGSFPRWGKHSRVTQAPPLRRGTDAGKPPGFCASRRGKAPYLVGRPRSGEKGRKKPEKSLIFPQKTLDPGKTLCYNPFYLSDERFLFARFFRRAQGFPGVQTGRQCPQNAGK